jgi:hypothetical protein
MSNIIDIDIENLPIDIYVGLNSSINIYLMLLSLDGTILEPTIKTLIEPKGTFLISVIFKYDDDHIKEADSVPKFIQEFIAKSR